MDKEKNLSGKKRKRVRLKKRVCICKFSNKLKPSLCAQLVDDLPIGHVLRGYTRLPKSKVRYDKNLRERYLFHLGIKESELPNTGDQWICRIHFSEECFVPGPPVQLKESIPVTRNTHKLDVISVGDGSSAIPTPNAVLKPKSAQEPDSTEMNTRRSQRQAKKSSTPNIHEAAAALIRFREVTFAQADRERKLKAKSEDEVSEISSSDGSVATHLEQSNRDLMTENGICEDGTDEQDGRSSTASSPILMSHWSTPDSRKENSMSQSNASCTGLAPISPTFPHLPPPHNSKLPPDPMSTTQATIQRLLLQNAFLQALRSHARSTTSNP